MPSARWPTSARRRWEARPRDGVVTLLDPARARVGKEVRLDLEARIGNLLRWVDRGVG